MKAFAFSAHAGRRAPMSCATFSLEIRCLTNGLMSSWRKPILKCAGWWTRCRRLWRQRRPPHGDDRTRSARRPGWAQLPDRELSRFSFRTQRQRSRPPRRGPGTPIRCGNPRSPRGCEPQSGRSLPFLETCRWFRDFLSCALACDGRAVEDPERARDRTLAGRGRLLRRWNDRSYSLSRRNSLYHWRREFRWTSRYAFLKVCRESGHAGARRVSCRHYVALLDRTNRKDAQHRGMDARERG